MRCALCRAASPRKGVDLRDILARLCRCRDGRTSSCPVSCVCAGSVWRLFVSLAEGCCPLCTVRYDVGRWRPYVGADDPLSWNRTRASGRARAVRRNGRIVNLGSIARGGGLPGYADYAACKAAVIELTETLAMENAKRGITVNSVLPCASSARLYAAGRRRRSRRFSHGWFATCGRRLRRGSSFRSSTRSCQSPRQPWLMQSSNTARIGARSYSQCLELEM